MDEQKLVEYDSYFCDSCRKYVYNEALGEPRLEVQAQTHVSDLTCSWRCPVCGADKSQLRAATMVDGFMPNTQLPKNA